MASETWRRVGRVLMCHVDMRLAIRARIANTDAPPHRYATMRPRDFLELMDPGRTYPDLDMPTENDTDPAA